MEYRVWDTPAYTFPVREAGILGAHSFSKYLLRDLFILVSMPGTLITQFLPLAIRVGQQMESKSGDSREGISVDLGGWG